MQWYGVEVVDAVGSSGAVSVLARDTLDALDRVSALCAGTSVVILTVGCVC